MKGLVLDHSGRRFQPIAAARREGGQPVRRFRKDLIRTGSYFKQADSLNFRVEAGTLQHWAAVFSQMRTNGVKVPVPNGHTFDADQNRGWVVDMLVEGDTLVGIIDLIGEDAIAMAGRSDVSIYSPPEFVDGRGSRYEWPITHVALCTDPVVPGLAGFVPIAASRRAATVDLEALRVREALAADVRRLAGLK